MRFISIVQAVSLVIPVLSGAQTVGSGWPPPSGSRVRIQAPFLGEKKQTVTVISATADTLFFRQSSQSVDRALSTAQITKIEIARGAHSHRMRNGLIGFAVGAVGGAIIGAATYKPSNTLAPDFGRGGDAAFGAGLGGIAGAIIGSVAGMHQTETWVPIDIPRRVTSITADRLH